MNVKGTIKVIEPTKEYGDNGFKKRTCVLTTDEQYPQSIELEFIQDKCALLDSYIVGDTVTIDINLRGREWVNPQGETKYFNNIQGWRMEKVGYNAPLAPVLKSRETPNTTSPFETINADDINVTEEEQDDLPF